MPAPRSSMILNACMTALSLAMTSVGCGVQDDRSATNASIAAEEITVAYLANMTDVRESLESVQDEESANAAAVKINAAAITATGLIERARRIESLTDEMFDAVIEKYSDQFAAEGTRIVELLVSIRKQGHGTPQLQDAINNLKSSAKLQKTATGTGSTPTP